jgi:hypothetical protein
MRRQQQGYGRWDDEDAYGEMPPDAYGEGYYQGEEPGGYDDGTYGADEERGLVLDPDQSLVGVSNAITTHGVPLLSYSRTMSRFYTSRKQRLSLGRYKCEVCGERIRFWAWETQNGSRTHDGCYERLAWTWTNLYAHQQRLAAEGRFE